MVYATIKPKLWQSHLTLIYDNLKKLRWKFKNPPWLFPCLYFRDLFFVSVYRSSKQIIKMAAHISNTILNYLPLSVGELSLIVIYFWPVQCSSVLQLSSLCKYIIQSCHFRINPFSFHPMLFCIYGYHVSFFWHKPIKHSTKY